MTFLPIVERELRAGARRNSTRYVRLTVAVIALFISLLQLAILPFLMGSGRTSGSAGLGLMTGYAFLLCLLAGVFVTADCLSEEKREGTLGLLFLTDLRGYDVVLGKLASQLIYLGYGLLAIIPAAALPMLFGGVTGSEFWRISLALANLLFFALATGMAASALLRKANVAITLTGLFLAGICLLLPLLQWTMDKFGAGEWTRWMCWFSPASAYSWANETMMVLHPNWFWRALGYSHLLGWLLLAVASWWLPRSWQERPVINRSSQASRARHQLGTSSGIQRRRHELEHDPWLWLIGESKGVKTIMLLMTFVWGAVLGIVAWANVSSITGVILIGGWIYLFIAKILFASQACRFFVETRRSGAFELLLSTPLSLDQLVAAQWAALRRTFGPALLWACGLAGLFALGGIITAITKDGSYSRASDAVSMTWIFGTLGLLVELLDFLALGYLGMWLALTMRKPHLATGATILCVMVARWGLRIVSASHMPR